MVIVNKISLGFKEENLLIGHDLKSQIIDDSHQYYNYIKKVLHKTRVNFLDLILPVFFMIMKHNLKQKMFDYNFFK